MIPIPPLAFAEILEELERRPITVNKYRDKAGAGRSQTFGLVNRRSLPVDYSRQGWLRPKLLYLLQEFANEYVTIPWTSITVNDNYQCQKHRDKGNHGMSFLVAFGDYTGGELKIYEGDLSGNHNIRYNAITADFSKVYHSVEPFQGKRYSLVFYNLKTTKMPSEPLPKGEAVFENGKFVFKRGDKIITPKEGLEHPLRGRKKVTNMTVAEGNFTVTFD